MGRSSAAPVQMREEIRSIAKMTIEI